MFAFTERLRFLRVFPFTQTQRAYAKTPTKLSPLSETGQVGPVTQTPAWARQASAESVRTARDFAGHPPGMYNKWLPVV